jgi:type II secretory pathway component GspD/PulD (secretin)
MKRLLLLLLLAPLVAWAAPVSFNFNAVPLVAFSQVVFKDLLHADYVVSPDVLSMDRKITLSVAGVEQDKALAFVEGILKQQGVSVDLRDGVYYLVPASKFALDVPAQVDMQRSLVSSAIAAPTDVERSAGRMPEAVTARRGKDDVTEFYAPQNRPADFLAALVVAAFGPKSAVPAGSGVLLTGTHDDVEKMRAVLSSVDSLPRLVDVSASWVEVTDNDSDGRGISLLANVLGAKLGVSLGTVNSGSAVSLKGSRFELVVDALKTDSRFKQISNSRVVGDEYEKLVLTVGDETPTISSTGRDNSGNSVQNIVYRPSGVIVDVLPKVLGSGRIQLSVDGQISNFKATSTGVTASPTLIKRQVKTQVTVGDGDVLLIGGLNDTQTAGSSSALSFLPSWAVRSSSSARTDLVLVLSAKVIKAD